MGASSHQERNQVELKYHRRKHAEEMKQQLISFALMIILTLASFAAVLYRDKMDPYFTVPFILLLAVVQLVFQLYYFMHMKNKGHSTQAFFLYSGLTVAVITLLTFLTLIWL
ncbi:MULTISPECIES: cytochrome c oxidase subunit IVB [unclassified Bacillus (in: firmicutes)]|uniref:cytochrome c oxidase subunit IVB n=1 Tax=unclassified Bacillus (in: firmicutes) TaxID=185979 RepID=UPI000BEFC66B|nr:MULTISPECIES: cytochrome c oxidase subunit IVB [unclassified Bacillus (in: firmicutes)]PEJ60356.1 cytochrome c oxidase subunit IVB [Bacillus sp. AFS002410]PEL10633.1 cytochrome c oxidase subunit IVB [Bacillus sp. AFS017336]